MKLKYLIISSFLFFLQVKAQQTVLTTGGNTSTTSGFVSFSVGQVDYTNQSNSSHIITQGVQQPFEFFTVKNHVVMLNQLNITVFPNPTQLNANLLLKNNYEQLTLTVYDGLGKMVYTTQLSEGIQTIPMENMSMGIYQFMVSNSTSVLKTFKILKIN